VVPQPQLDNNNHVLLSSLDETIIENKEEFHLGVHMYPDGIFAPRGHKYLRDFTADPMPKLTYRIGNVVLDKELIFSSTEARLFVRYTLREAVVPITLRVQPFLAFRNVHMLTHENYDASRIQGLFAAVPAIQQVGGIHAHPALVLQYVLYP